jgi:hypothetical protein
MSLQTQIQPYLGVGSNTGLPDGVNPDQTFKAYVESLLNANTKGFSGTFVDDPTQQSQQSKTPTTSITEGLFSKYLNDGGGGDSDGSPSGPSGSGPHANTPSAAAVLGAQNVAQTVSPHASTIGQIGGMLFGLPGTLLGRGIPTLAQMHADAQWDAFNKGIDISNNAFNDAAMLGGLMTVSDANGNVSTVSNQSAIDAYDTSVFGTTGANLGDPGGSGPSAGPGEGNTGQGPSGVGPSW